MLKLNFLRIASLLSFALFISGCQVSAKSDSKYSSLDELKDIEFPSLEAPKGLAEGAFETNYDNGNPETKTWVRNGCFDRYINTFYENGQPESEIAIKNCKINGKIRNYHENGRLEIELMAVNSKLSGPFVLYYDTQKNSPHVKGTFKNGELVGTLIEYDENGKVIVKADVIDGKIHE